MLDAFRGPEGHGAPRARRAVLVLAYAALLGSCDNPLGPDTSTVGRIDVQPQVLNLTAGQTAPVTARVFDQNDEEMVARVFWSSQNPSIATIDQSGVVTASAPGATQVAASSGGRSAFVAVTVTARPVAIVRLSPPAGNVIVGETLQLAAEVLDGAGGPIVGRLPAWTSSDPAAATVNGNGLVTGVTPGAATIRAVVDGIEGSAVVTVLPAPVASITVTPPNATIEIGRTQAYAAVARDADGAPLAGRTIVWSSSNDAVAGVSQGGVVTGISAGSATITASSPGNGPGGTTPSGNATVDVTLVPVARVQIVPPAASVRQGDVTAFTANLFAANDEPLTGAGRAIVWSSSNPAVATIDPSTGVATGIAIGATTISADVTTPGQPAAAHATATLTVSTVPVASVVVTPNPGVVHLGPAYARQFSAAFLDAQGAPLTGRSAVWTSTNQAVATVDEGTGIVTGVSAGTAQIRAVSEGVQGSATVTIDLVPVSAVLVTPSSATLIPPATQSLAATPRDSAGNVLTGVALGGRSATWSSANPAIASVDASGIVTAHSQGTTAITGTIGGTSGAAQITVLPSAGSVTIAITPDSIIAPATRGGTITVRDAGGQPLAGRPVSIASSDPAVATVAPANAATSPTGTVAVTVTALAGGTTNISASSESKTGAFTLRVLNPVSSVSVTSPGDSIIGTATLQATATLRDAGNVVLTGRPIAWTTNNPGVATVNASTGLIAGVAPGTATITAASEGKSGTRNVRVLSPVQTIVITSPGDSIIGTLTLQPAVTLRDASNTVLTGRPVVWSSANTGVATVNATSGLITGVAPGTTTITAASEGKTGTLAVRVLPPGASVSLSAPSDSLIGPGTLAATVTVRDATSSPVPGRQVSIASGAPSVATVAPGTATTDAAGQVGLVITRVASGSATITATSSGLSGTLTVRMLPPVTAVSLTSAGDSIIGTGALQANATLRDAASAVLAGRPIAWSTSNASVASVSTSGLVTGVAAGTATITATAEGISGTLDVRVLPAVATLSLTAPADSMIGSGSNLFATVTLLDGGGAPIGGRTVTIASSASSVATVAPLNGTSAPNGQVPVSITSVAPGTATISATSSGLQSALVVRVLAPVHAVAVAAPGDSVIGTGSLQATAMLADAAANPVTGRPVEWASSNPAIAAVSVTGLITGVATGTANITATSEGVTSGVLAIRVLPAVGSIAVTASTDSLIGPAGANLPATATVRDAGNAAIPGRTVTLSSSNTGVATVSPASATSDASGNVSFVITSVSAGNAAITATSAGVTGTLDVRMLAPVASVTVAAPADSLIGTGTIQASAVLRDAAASILSGRPVSWSSSSTGVATVSGTGLVTAVAPGTTDVTAMSEGVTSAALPIRILAGVASVSIVTAGDSIMGTGTLQATAVLQDAANNTLTGRPVSWTSSNPSIASIDAATGLLTGVTPGSVTITATSEGVASPALPIRVLAPVGSVSLTPSADSIIGSGSVAASVLLLDGASAPLEGRLVSVSSGNASVATVAPATGVTDAAGTLALTISAVAPGTATLTASSGGVSGTADIRVLAPVSAVLVTAAGDSIIGAATLQLAATLRDAASNPITGRPVAWSTSNASIAAVDAATGLVTGVAPGTATITATSEGVAGTMDVRILAPVSLVTVAAAGDSLIGTGSLAAAAALWDAANNPLTGRPVSWNSSNTNIATVDAASGVITGVAPGMATITATSEGQSGTLDVRVLPAVTVITVVTVSDSLIGPGTLAGTVTLRDASNQPLAGRPVNIASSVPGFATVAPAIDTSDTNGEVAISVTYVAAGNLNVSATSESALGAKALRMLAPAASVTLSPPSRTMAANDSKPFTADVKDAGGFALPGRSCSTSSSAPLTATVSPATAVTDANGQITITATTPAQPVAGTATLTVTCGSVSGTATVTFP